MKKNSNGDTKLSHDIFNGIHIDIRGRDCIYVSGCKEIILYTEDMLRIMLKNCIMTVIGDKLHCNTYRNGTIEVGGSFSEIKFDDTGKR